MSFASVLQGGATEMKEQHRPLDETGFRPNPAGLPRHMGRRAKEHDEATRADVAFESRTFEGDA